jgi:hypothetical protein
VLLGAGHELVGRREDARDGLPRVKPCAEFIASLIPSVNATSTSLDFSSTAPC